MTFEVGGYRALRPLGPGRRARVWVAEPLAGGTEVVLQLHQPARRPQLSAELDLARRLHHPHLLPVLGIAESDDRIALVTTLAPGGSLRDLLTDGPLSEGQTVTVLAAASSALAACHAAGHAHGDVAAGSVLFTGDGRPLLAGFGAVPAALSSGDAPPLSPPYLSPEVARGADPTPSDDVFALGSVALHCLTGVPAWPAQDVRDVLIQSSFGQWPGPDRSTGPELASLVRAMLDKDPARRPTAARINLMLASCAAPEPIGAGEPAAAVLPVPRDDTAPVATRRGRHAVHEDDQSLARSEAEPGPAGAAAGWLDLDVAPTWTLGSPEPQRPAAGDAADPTDPTGAASRLAMSPLGGTRMIGRPRRPPRRVDRRAAAMLTAIVVVLAGGSVAAGLWWATADAPAEVQTASYLLTPAQPPPSASSAEATGASGPAAPNTAAVDWLAVVTDLDRRRADAFARADPAALDAVYTPTSSGLAVDRQKISELGASGLHVTEPVHAIESAVLVDGPGVSVRVTDSMPPHDIVDASGSVVGQTVAQPSTTRIWLLAEADGGYRVVQISAD